MKPIVVLGSGLAGYTVIRELRKLNRDVPIKMVTRDDGNYYSKPMLSNAFAQGKDAQKLVITAAQDMAQQLNIEVLAHCDITAINVENKCVKSSHGNFEYEKLVLALGADAIRIPLQGDAADAVLSINDLGDYARFREAMTGVHRIAIMGGGLIGCEFANDLVAAGYAVTVIDPAAYPLASLMPQAAGSQLLEPLAALGVDWRFGTSVQRVDATTSGYELTLANGERLQVDLLLSAIGLRPRVALATAAGIHVNRGIVVDAHLRSSAADVFALGDCAEIEARVLPFVLPIMHAARALARTLAGEETAAIFPAMPVVVKTPTHPIAVLPVARDALGHWQTESLKNGAKMLFVDAEQRMTGFVLTGKFAIDRNEMSKRVGAKI